MGVRRDIRSAEELAKIGLSPEYPADGVYKLRCDIQIEGPWQSLPPADGIELYGEGYWIGPLSAPLFESLSRAVIQHVRLELAIDVRHEQDPAEHEGSADFVDSQHSSDSARDTSRGLLSVGGLARLGERVDMDACETYGSVTGIVRAGGFFGELIDSDIWGLHNYANVSAIAGLAGGVAGIGHGNRYKDCWNHGRISAMGMLADAPRGIAGGIIGQETPAMREHEDDPREPFIEFCTNRGAIESYADAGGIVGRIAKPDGESGAPFTMLWCGNFGEIACGSMGQHAVDGNTRFGGIVGHAMRPCYISECYNQNKVCGGAYIGGIVGLGEGDADTALDGAIEYCVNYDLICLSDETTPGMRSSPNGCAGGIAGAAVSFGGFFQCTNKMTICSDCPYTGGLVGRLVDGEMRGCVNEGFVHCMAGEAGGIVGGASDTGDADAEPLCALIACENHGDVEGGAQAAGGIAGRLLDGVRLERCVNWGCVRSAMGAYVGGIAGFAGYSSDENSGSVRKNRIVDALSASTHVQGAFSVHRVLGGEDVQGSTEISAQADRGTLLTCDNTALGGLRYQESTVLNGDDQLGLLRMQGESISSAATAAERIRGMQGAAANGSV
ncbi:hypothetical protein FACS1894184_15630 [Clostridia bacterium]|nr:hypothetical protein FACS1894184_15630 [Clostridia bacterium]